MEGKDYFEIQNLLHSYPYRLDRGDFDAVGALFTHAVVYSGGSLLSDRSAATMAQAFRDWVIVHPDGTPRTRHYIANLIIEPDGTDGAIARSYVMVFQQTQSLPLQPVIGGDYLDTLRKVDGQWRIVERQMGNDLVGNLTDHGKHLGTIKPHRANR
ncbi:MAG: nuclear transport factor 2 family protein [Proteobacteria bacterium]|nr:nuclear transport factor 2 family protein [Pseudomonadota bacterium]HQR03286.1 nuclear transport factor 2 family protein [Rhodocyclaceae bacterium]